MITIQNMHDQQPKKSYDVRVDRVSILGSPFYLNDEKDRDNILDQYEKWFHDCINTPANQRTTFKYELNRLITLYRTFGQLNLFCWCAPKRCHAETIKQYIKDQIE